MPLSWFLALNARPPGALARQTGPSPSPLHGCNTKRDNVLTTAARNLFFSPLQLFCQTRQYDRHTHVLVYSSHRILRAYAVSSCTRNARLRVLRLSQRLASHRLCGLQLHSILVKLLFRRRSLPPEQSLLWRYWIHVPRSMRWVCARSP
jgi:hypothetical protein